MSTCSDLSVGNGGGVALRAQVAALEQHVAHAEAIVAESRAAVSRAMVAVKERRHEADLMALSAPSGGVYPELLTAELSTSAVRRM